jgi:hypothetical protein
MEKLKSGSVQVVAQKKLEDFFNHPVNQEINEIFQDVFGQEKAKVNWQSANSLASDTSSAELDSGDSMTDKDQELSLDDLGDLEIDSNSSQEPPSFEEEGFELSLDSTSDLDLAAPDELPPDQSDLDEGTDFSLDESIEDAHDTVSNTNSLTDLEDDIPPLDFGASESVEADMSKETMDKLKEIDALMDLDASQASIQLSDELALGGDELALGGDDLDLGGDDLGGDDLDLGGDELDLGGDELDLGGDELDLGGDDLALGGDELALGGDELALGGDELALGGDELGLASDELSFEHDELAVSESPSKEIEEDGLSLESEFSNDLDTPLVSDDLNLDSLNFSADEPEIKEEKTKKKVKEVKEAKESTPIASERETTIVQTSAPYQGNIGRDLNDIKVAYSAEMERMQATLSNLRTDREELLSKIDKLEEDKLSQNRHVLNLRAELDEKKIELSIIRKKLNDEINELKDRLKVYDEKKLIIEEKNKILMSEMEKVAQKNKIDLKRVQMRERELEQRLELLKADSETQIRHRDLKILELKRKIDSMEFDMESITVQEKRSVESRFELEDKLDKAIKTLRSAISTLEEESDKTSAIEALKKNIDM